MANLVVVCHRESHRLVTVQGRYESDPSRVGIIRLSQLEN